MEQDTLRAVARSVDPAEIARFAALAEEWWNPRGKFRPLHVFNPVRLGFIRDVVGQHFGRDARALQPFDGLRVLDIGCGGGLIAEPMARLGAAVTGVDAGQPTIAAAAHHAQSQGLAIDYRVGSAEALVAEGEHFDVVLNLEVVEHVADVGAFLAATGALVRPGGLMIVATINRTPKAFALAIVGAEYVLGWLPRGTHRYDKLVRPKELAQALAASGLTVLRETGVSYSPLDDRWRLSADQSVNYMVVAEKRP